MAQHTCTVNPPDRTEANQSPASAPHHPVLDTYAHLSSLTLPLFTQNAIRVKLIQNKVKFYSTFICSATTCANVHQQHTCLSGTLYVNLQWELNDSEFILWGCYKFFLKRTTVCVDEAESNSLFILNQLCRHPARYHHLVMWKTRHRQAHSLKPKVNGTWEIKTTSLGGWDELRKWQSSLGRPHHCLFLVKNTTGFFLKAPPLIRSDQLTCALNFPSGRTGVK